MVERAEPVPAGTEEEPEPAEGDEDVAPGMTRVYISEETRLADTVAAIDFAAAVVPRGALIMDANENVVMNRSFCGAQLSLRFESCHLFCEAGQTKLWCASGLEGAEVSDPSSYCHFRPVANPKTQIKLGSSASATLDIFESLADDVPRGCWSFVTSSTGNAMLLRNLVWPGFVGYASMGGPGWGYAYFGNGLKNQDIAFML